MPTEPEPRYVVLYDLAEYLGISGDALVKRVRSKGYKTIKARRPSTGGIARAVTVEDAKRIKEEHANGPTVVSPEDIFKP